MAGIRFYNKTITWIVKHVKWGEGGGQSIASLPTKTSKHKINSSDLLLTNKLHRL